MIRKLIPGIALTLLAASGASFAASSSNTVTGNSPTTAVRHTDTATPATPATPAKAPAKAKKRHHHHAKTAPKK